MPFHVGFLNLDNIIFGAGGALVGAFAFYLFNRIIPTEYALRRDKQIRESEQRREWYRDVKSNLTRLILHGHEITRAGEVNPAEAQEYINPIPLNLIDLASRTPDGVPEEIEAGVYRAGGFSRMVRETLEMQRTQSFTELVKRLESLIVFKEIDISDQIEYFETHAEEAHEAGLELGEEWRENPDIEVDEQALSETLDEFDLGFESGEYPKTASDLIESVPYEMIDETYPDGAFEEIRDYAVGKIFNMIFFEEPAELLDKIEAVEE